MKIYNKHLKSYSKEELNETNLVKTISVFKKSIELITNLMILKKVDLDEYELDERIQDILSMLDDLLRKYNLEPVYRDMIHCGVNTALKNLNYKNRKNIGY